MATRNACEYCAIRSGALCRALPLPALPRVNRVAMHKRVAAGRLVVILPQDQGGLTNIVSGVVKLVRSLPDGRQQIVALLFSGDFVGDPLGAGNTVMAVAASNVELCSISRQHFEGLLAEHPQMQRLLVEHMLAELDAARDWMLLLGRKTAEERVASLFLLLAERELKTNCVQPKDDGVPLRMILPISRADIADCVGVTIETVSRQILKLKTDDVLRFEGQRRVVVPDLAALWSRAGGME